MRTKARKELDFMQGGGVMGELMRSKDWSASLGDPGQWPESLRTTVSIVLNSRFPMFIWWGKNLITIYNDAYMVIAGEKHPGALGMPGKNVWSEIWDVVGPLADRVMMKGESTWAEDQLLYINRHGYVEESYFTFSYSPIYTETGEIGGVFCACTETTDKVVANRRIRESEKNLRNIILQAPVAMCILHGPSFIVQIANAPMFELWGKRPEELLHQPIFTGLPEAREQGLEELLQHVFTKGETFAASERPVTLPRNGKIETVYINFVYEPFRDNDGVITGVMAVAIDVTQQVLARKRIEESEQTLQLRVNERTAELEKANQDLQRSNVNLEEFAYAASHDLKEPIRKVHFFTDRLKADLKEKLDNNQNQLFERMENATQRMGSLVDDLLSYSQVSRGVPDMEDLSLNQKVKNVLEDLELEVQEKKAVIKVGELPNIKGNKRQMQQLFQNLISNALKYSKPGTPPEITISSREVTGNMARPDLPPEDGSKKYHLIEVKDNGIGFESKDADRIFNVFTRLHGSSEYRGTGVGLSIVRKVVESHHGVIWAESTPGKGSSFKLLLPKS